MRKDAERCGSLIHALLIMRSGRLKMRCMAQGILARGPAGTESLHFNRKYQEAGKFITPDKDAEGKAA